MTCNISGILKIQSDKTKCDLSGFLKGLFLGKKIN